MNETNPAKIIIYTILLIAAIALTVFAFTELDSIANNSSIILVGVALGAIDAFVPILLGMIFFRINKTFGRITAIVLMLIQISIIIYIISVLSLLEALGNIFVVTQVVLYVVAIVIMIINLIKTGKI